MAISSVGGQPSNLDIPYSEQANSVEDPSTGEVVSTEADSGGSWYDLAKEIDRKSRLKDVVIDGQKYTLPKHYAENREAMQGFINFLVYTGQTRSR